MSQISCISVIAFLLVFALSHIQLGNISFALTLGGFAVANAVALFLHQHYNKPTLFGYYLIGSFGINCIFLIFSAEGFDSGLLWLPCFPVICYNILTLYMAVLANIMMAMVVGYIVFIAPSSIYEASYGLSYKIVALASFTLTSSFSYFQARSRDKAARENYRLTTELQMIASTDELTKLPNRRDMTARLDFEMKRCKRSGSEFSILLTDIDYFKRINDNFGHDVGDQVLKSFSSSFAARFRDTDKIGRWGGEEFLAILPNTKLTEALELANSVRKSILKSSLLPNCPNRLVTISVGIASSTECDNYNDLLKLADQRLYLAKDNGRNRVEAGTSENAPAEPAVSAEQ